MIVTLIITAIGITILFYIAAPAYSSQVWVVEHDGYRYWPKQKDRCDLGKDEEYSEDYMPAFRTARRLNRWHGYE